MKNMIKKVFLLILVVMLSVNCYAGGNRIKIKGSDTLINLVQKMSERYMQVNPNQVLAITGGGSGTGIAALINKKCDIANASRLMKPKEIKRAQKKKVNPKRVVIAMDGLSVITHKNNPIKKLTVSEVGKIFRGEITNWKELGGEDIRITLYGRQSNSGTFVFFRDFVVKADYSKKMNRMNGNSQIVEALKRDKSGIGYVGVGYVKNEPSVTVLSIARKKSGLYASPLNKQHVLSGKYPITRPLNQYVSGSMKGHLKQFIEFELSPAGQKIVEEEGFFPIPQEYKNYNKKSVGI